MSTAHNFDLAPMANYLPSAAFGLFRYWTAAVNLPAEIAVRSEEVLVENLRDVLHGALRALNRKSTTTQKPPGWEVGFVIGYVDGSLAQLWQHEYISKRAEPYKAVLALRAVELFFKTNELANIQVERLYVELLEADSNIMSPDYEVTQLQLNPKTRQVFPTDTKGRVATLLNNLLLQQIKSSIEPATEVQLPVRDHLPEKVIRALIDLNS